MIRLDWILLPSFTWSFFISLSVPIYLYLFAVVILLFFHCIRIIVVSLDYVVFSFIAVQ